MDLTNAIDYAAHLPGGSVFKDWGRGLPSAGQTEKLPKVYWLAGRGPTTCAFQLDVIPSEPTAVERFGLFAIAIAAEKILRICMLGRSQVGSELLGENKAVSITMVRTDAPRLGYWKGSWIETLALENGIELQVASLNTTEPATRGSIMQLDVDDYLDQKDSTLDES